MVTDQPGMRMRLTVVKVVNCARVQGRFYDRMEFTAKSDRTDKEVTFITFKPEIIDAVFEGNSFPADVVIETKNGKTESVVVKAYLPDSREAAETLRTVIMSVSDNINSKIDIPDDVEDNHWALVRKIQGDGLK